MEFEKFVEEVRNEGFSGAEIGFEAFWRWLEAVDCEEEEPVEEL